MCKVKVIIEPNLNLVEGCLSYHKHSTNAFCSCSYKHKRNNSKQYIFPLSGTSIIALKLTKWNIRKQRRGKASRGHRCFYSFLGQQKDFPPDYQAERCFILYQETSGSGATPSCGFIRVGAGHLSLRSGDSQRPLGLPRVANLP